jgi:hypothetical protein
MITKTYPHHDAAFCSTKDFVQEMVNTAQNEWEGQLPCVLGLKE